MSDETGGYRNPPKRSQFKPGQSGNPKGRPRKPRRGLLPSQTRKDFLREIDKIVEVATPTGIERVTKGELIVRNIVNGAAKGKPTALKMYQRMLDDALTERMELYASVRLTELLRSMHDDPVSNLTQIDHLTLDGMLKQIKNFY